MFHYEKKLQFPVKIATPNPKLAAFIISQYGGPYSIRLQKAGAVGSGFLYSTPWRHSLQSLSPLLSKNSAFPWNSVFR